MRLQPVLPYFFLLLASPHFANFHHQTHTSPRAHSACGFLPRGSFASVSPGLGLSSLLHPLFRVPFLLDDACPTALWHFKLLARKINSLCSTDHPLLFSCRAGGCAGPFRRTGGTTTYLAMSRVCVWDARGRGKILIRRKRKDVGEFDLLTKYSVEEKIMSEQRPRKERIKRTKTPANKAGNNQDTHTCKSSLQLLCVCEKTKRWEDPIYSCVAPLAHLPPRLPELSADPCHTSCSFFSSLHTHPSARLLLVCALTGWPFKQRRASATLSGRILSRQTPPLSHIHLAPSPSPSLGPCPFSGRICISPNHRSKSEIWEGDQ